jgi:hypothetical protein
MMIFIMAIKEENSIGARIIRALNVKDLKEAAQILGENYSSLHNWSSQRRDFPTNVLIKIARLTNTSVDWILTGENANSPAFAENQTFEKLLEEKIRRIVREEIADGAAIHEKIQGIILAMKPNVNEQNAFGERGKEEKAA